MEGKIGDYRIPGAYSIAFNLVSISHCMFSGRLRLLLSLLSAAVRYSLVVSLVHPCPGRTYILSFQRANHDLAEFFF